MKWLKKYKLFESDWWSNIEDLQQQVSEIFLESQEESGLQINYSTIRKDVEIDPEKWINNKRTDTFLEVSISKPWRSPNRVIPGVVNPEGGYPGNLFFWYEIKDSIIRLTEWYYSHSGRDYSPGISGKLKSELSKIGIKYNSNSPLRFFGHGVEMFVGCSKEEDFRGIGDFISFTSLRIEIKL